MIFSEKCLCCGSCAGEKIVPAGTGAQMNSGDFQLQNLCAICFDKIAFLKGPLNLRVRKNIRNAYSIAAYEGPMEIIISSFKYEKKTVADRMVKRVVQKYLSAWINPEDEIAMYGNGIINAVSESAEQISGIQVDAIVPVPLSPGRYMKRGFNQSVVIALAVSKRLKKPVLMRALSRKFFGRRQVGLDLVARRENIKWAFRVPSLFSDSVYGKDVLLVDDVVTSGATADEAARILKRAGAKNVDLLTLAKRL